MKVKTYVADNVQEAFYKVKTDMGKDAVILQTKHIRKGGFLGFFSKSMVEVVAASDISMSSESPKKPVFNPIPSGFTYAKEPNIEKLENIRSEISEVKNMIKNLYSAQGNQRGFYYDQELPLHLKGFYNKMAFMEVDADIIKNVLINVVKKLPDENINNPEKVFKTIKEELILQIDRIEPIKLSDKSHTSVAFIGPTGVGKTTTIAKLAAYFTLYQGKKVAMITADTFRVGAIEQLKLYGELLEIPVKVVYRLEDVKTILSELKNYDLLLIDTMGSSPGNKMQIKKIKSLLDNINPTDIHMVLSATTKTHDIGEILDNYKELNYKKLLITKLDETKTYGFILNALKLTKCSLSYITAGQNVPDDIEVASAEKIADMILGGKWDV